MLKMPSPYILPVRSPYLQVGLFVALSAAQPLFAQNPATRSPSQAGIGNGAGTQTTTTLSNSAASTQPANQLAGQVAGQAIGNPAQTEEPIPAGLIQLRPESSYYSPYAFVVDKKQRTLTVWTHDKKGLKKISSFPADLGKKEGEKQSLGDRKTPTGIYFLMERLEGSNLDFNLYGKRAFTTNYPNYFDRLDGKTGSGIWLHAVPDTVTLNRGSRGCVVVRNDVIQELTQYVKTGKTPILIEDETEWQKPSYLKAVNESAVTFIEGWRKAWEAKDLDKYMSYYSNDFEGLGMNKTKWRSYKEKLNQTYQTLSVKLSQPIIYGYKNKVVARFLQAYDSGLHADFGEKIIYLTRNGDHFEIVGEEWSEETSPLAREEMHQSSTASTSALVDTQAAPKL